MRPWPENTPRTTADKEELEMIKELSSLRSNRTTYYCIIVQPIQTICASSDDR